MESPNTAEQPPVSSGRVRSIISSFETLIRASTPPAESSSGRNRRQGKMTASSPAPESSSGRNQGLLEGLALTPSLHAESSGQNNRKSSDGPIIAPPTIPVRPRISPFADLMMPSTSAESSSSGSNHPPFHVFINHCGQDTLANTIYKKLKATGLRVFLDKDEIKHGDFFPQVLENAIANASLHIAIFSQHYIKSAWCLAELAFMLQTMVQTQAKFIPIFYHVEPSILRREFQETEIYANDFYKHEKNRYNRETLESWKSALHKASSYNGAIINNQSDEEKAVMNVVSHVLKELKRMMLNVAKYPVGLDEREQEFHNIASQSFGPIKIVGIWGMGGVGKTTLAKHLYNKKCSSFQKSSFLFDVREAANTRQLHEKQKKLLKDLKYETLNFDSVDKGKEILRNRLKSVSALIVLDDVDHKDQLDALLPARDNLGQGSLIIVTTRELAVLKVWDISAIYKIGTLDPSYAKELFCWHAFGQPSPFIDLKEIAEKFINACHGLPLSLKFLGNLLHGELNKDYWQSQLDKLSRILPADIKSRLKISYDALDNEEKEMFLDVACFFIGWTINSTIAVWNGSKWTGLLGWKRLMNKCLVELDKDNNIRMDDHLRDMGREIANKQSPYRLWSENQIIEIQPKQLAIKVRGILSNAFGDNCYPQNGKIILNTTQGARILAPGSLGLKIFIGQGDIINEEFGELSRELLCFSCFDFAHTKIPSWLPLKKLRVLKLHEPRKLEELWERDEDVSIMKLDYYFCNAKYVNRIESWLQAPVELRHLLIRGGLELKKMSGLQRLKSLETLQIYGCGELSTLPSLAELTSLKEIDLKRCSELEKIEGIEGLRSLETLHIQDCEELKTLPRLAELTSLKEIYLNGCSKLEKIEGIEGLRSLETLHIQDCEELKTLPRLAELTSLKEIYLNGWSKLEKIEGIEGLRSLETLHIQDSEELKTLPRLAELTSLKEIYLNGCSKLLKIEGIEGLRSLKTIEITNCAALDTLPSLAELTSLEKLKVHMWSMRPCILKLPEQSETLESVEVVANRVVVPEIQKWGREEIICTKAVIDVRKFLTSHMLPEDVLQTYSSQIVPHSLSGRELRLRMPKSGGNGNAILICAIIHSIHPDLSFEISTDNGSCFETVMSNEKWLGMGIIPQESIWVWMGTFPQQSRWLSSQEYKIQARGDEKVEAREGWLMRGREQSIRQAFCRLSQR